jgi:hypothetical protein
MVAGLLALALALTDTVPNGARHLDTMSVAPGDSVPAVTLVPPPLAAVAALPTVFPVGPFVPADTGTRKRTRAVEYSEWYGRRVAIHKTLSWAMFPLFAVSYYTGDQLAQKGRRGVSSTVRSLHPVAAGGAAAVFGVNTVTGLWNLWDARKDPADRKRRYLHSALFLLADAGFAYAGSLGEDAGEDGETRRRHRTIALGSMGLSTAGWLTMFLRKD